jgi:uncharacterized protein with NRDE domain
MCVLFVAKNICPKYPLIIIANRDEYHQRPTAKLHRWPDSNIIAGRDLEANGSWLGVNERGSIAALTNIRGAQYQKTSPPSRGQLITDYLTFEGSDQEFSQQLQQQANSYSGFNLLFGNPEHLYAFNNVKGTIEPLSDGIHGLSNAALNDPWPKIQRGIDQLTHYLTHTETPQPAELVALMQNKQTAPDHALPQTGIDLELERLLAPIFIVSEQYGTRSSSILLFDQQQQLRFIEYSYDNAGTIIYQIEIKQSLTSPSTEP